MQYMTADIVTDLYRKMWKKIFKLCPRKFYELHKNTNKEFYGKEEVAFRSICFLVNELVLMCPS